MPKYKNITLIGTSHISKESIKLVEKTIKKLKPKVVALELDKQRFLSLMTNKKRKLNLKDIKKLGFKGYLFNAIGAYVEKKLGKTVGTTPGDEMRKACEIAKEEQSKIALIDQDVTTTLKRLSKSITWKEKWTFIKEIMSSMIIKKNKIKFDLNKVPSEQIIKKLTKEVKVKYPSVYKILVLERNQIMAKNLYKIANTYKGEEIVGVIGAGHVDDIITLLKKEKWISKEKK